MDQPKKRGRGRPPNIANPLKRQKYELWREAHDGPGHVKLAELAKVSQVSQKTVSRGILAARRLAQEAAAVEGVNPPSVFWRRRGAPFTAIQRPVA